MRTYAADINKEMEGKEIELAGWVHETRDHGKLRFLILRDMSGLVQVTGKKETVSVDVFENLSLPKESVVSIKGKVKAEPQAPGGIEVVPSKIDVLNKVSLLLPVDPTEKIVSELDVRLDNRHIDLRRKKIHAIFSIEADILRAFREKLSGMGFEEIVPPCITAAATEGGTELFPVVYFDREAFLVQSPQLYKQLAVIGGMEKVFMTTPVFRAEPHNTTTHLNQVLQMDAEMAFKDDEEAMDVLEDVFLYILESVKKNCAKELEAVGATVTIPKKVERHTYTDIVDMLNENGHPFAWGVDFSKVDEKKMAELLKEEAFLITRWPSKVRAFYALPRDARICNAFDLMYRGLELASGAQRVHDPAVLVEQLKERGLNPDSFKFYIDAFKSGAPPHAGWSIGLERIAMQICQLPNIRECELFPRDMKRLTP